MLDHLVDLRPGVWNRLLRRPGVRIFADRFRRIGKVEAVIQFHGFIPIVELRRPADAIVARHATERFFPLKDSITNLYRRSMTAVFAFGISAVIDRRYSLTGRTERDSVAKRRQSQRRSVTIRREVEEIVVWVKEF